MIQITESPWLDSTPRDLRGSCGADVEIIKSNVQAGMANLYHLTGNGVDVWAVTRGEDAAYGKEFVVCCVGGRGMRLAGHALKEAAIQSGFNSIRYHTKNAAVQRLYKRFGFAGNEVERVYRLNLSGGVA